mmetsp:Transcript_19302/g.35543  ORF Transcript_19302/g.35543 Transcript_19302/m.35543 type:complete len:335 (+) Transcript_19302:894-1898(+)
MEEDTKFMEWLAVIERDALHSERPSPQLFRSPQESPVHKYDLTIERLLAQGKKYARNRENAKLTIEKSSQVPSLRNSAKLSPSSKEQVEHADKLMKAKNQLLLKLERLKLQQVKTMKAQPSTPSLCKRSLRIAKSQGRPKAVEERLMIEGLKRQQANLTAKYKEPLYHHPLISPKAARLKRAGSVTTRLYNYSGIYARHIERLKKERPSPSFTPTILTCSSGQSSPILKSQAVVKEEFPFKPMICTYSLKLLENRSKTSRKLPILKTDFSSPIKTPTSKTTLSRLENLYSPTAKAKTSRPKLTEDDLECTFRPRLLDNRHSSKTKPFASKSKAS